MKIGGKKIGGSFGDKISSVGNKVGNALGANKDWSDPRTLATAAISYYTAGQLSGVLGVPGSPGTIATGTPFQTPLTIPGLVGGAALTNYLAPDKIAPPGGTNIDSPPTIDETNDPNLTDQFKRMRAAARGLGRAGTFSRRDRAATLGLDAPLGSSMSLTGT